MQTEVYSSGELAADKVGMDTLVNVVFKRALHASIRVLVTYGKPNMQTDPCMRFSIVLYRGSEEKLIVALLPGTSKMVSVGEFDFNPSDQVGVFAAAGDVVEGQVGATIFVDVE